MLIGGILLHTITHDKGTEGREGDPGGGGGGDGGTRPPLISVGGDLPPRKI